jgi:hypothetical protein
MRTYPVLLPRGSARFSEVEPESYQDHGIELERGHVTVQLVFFRLHIGLKRGIGLNGSTVHSSSIASASPQGECGAGSAGVNDSNLKGDAEMAVVAREQVSPAYGEHGSNLGEVDLPGAMGWHRWSKWCC